MTENNGSQQGFMEKGILTDFQVSEPASTFGSIVPPVSIASHPNFSNLATVSIEIDDLTDKVWLNASVGLVAQFSNAHTVDVTLQILRGTTLIYQTVKSLSSTSSGTVRETVYLEHVDTTPLTGSPAAVNYTLRAQANDSIVTTSGPITFTAAEIE